MRVYESRDKKLSLIEIKKIKIHSYPVWKKEKSKFDWFYDSKEIYYFLEGKSTSDEVNFLKGKKLILKLRH